MVRINNNYNKLHLWYRYTFNRKIRDIKILHFRLDFCSPNPLGRTPGGYFREFWIGVCREGS